MELGSAVPEVRQDDRGRRGHPELLSRRPQGRDRQVFALRRSGFGRSPQARRRHQGEADRRHLHHLQGPYHGQQGQGRDHGRHRSRPEGSRTREDGLSGGRRDRSYFVTTDAADPVEAVGIAPAADAGFLPGFLQRYGASIEYLLIPGAALGGALAVFGVFVALFGKSPLDLYFYMYQGAFGTWFSWQNTLTRAAPLILTALCTALPAQLGMVIIGGEGSLLICAL